MLQRKPGIFNSRRQRNILFQKIKRHANASISDFVVSFFHELFLSTVVSKLQNKPVENGYKTVTIKPNWYDPCFWHIKFHGDRVNILNRKIKTTPSDYIFGYHSTTGERLTINKATIIERKQKLDLI